MLETREDKVSEKLDKGQKILYLCTRFRHQRVPGHSQPNYPSKFFIMKEETIETMIGGTRCPDQQAEQEARLHENEQTQSLQSNEQAASQLSNEQEAILQGDQQGASQLSDQQEAILQGDQQAEGQLNDNQTDGLHAETQAEEQDDLLPAEIFLREHCEFRYNVLADKIEVRARKGGVWGPWHYLDKMEFNSIVVAARRARRFC